MSTQFLSDCQRFYAAIEGGDVNKARSIILKYQQIDENETSESSLRKLLDYRHDDDLHISEQLKWSVLHVAVVNDDIDMIKFLVEECQFDINLVDHEGLTAIMFELTVTFGDIDLLKYFFEHCEIDLNVRTKKGRTMLHYAVGAGNLPALKFLIEACGADLQIIDNDGMSAIAYAKQCNHQVMIEYLSSIERLCNSSIDEL